MRDAGQKPHSGKFGRIMRYPEKAGRGVPAKAPALDGRNDHRYCFGPYRKHRGHHEECWKCECRSWPR
jgi:hypothetical protein